MPAIIAKSIAILSDAESIATEGNYPTTIACSLVSSVSWIVMVVETARRLGILLIADEFYSHLCFEYKPFVSAGVFGTVTPVVTLGSLSKRWIIPGWRLGWIAINDPNAILQKTVVYSLPI